MILYKHHAVPGTQTKAFAGHRVWSFLPNFYRVDRFARCFPCSAQGIQCVNDFITLKPKFYWKWQNKEQTERYKEFVLNIKITDNSYDITKSKFNGSLPKPYPCPRPESCRGGLDSSCATEYGYVFSYHQFHLFSFATFGIKDGYVNYVPKPCTKRL